MIRKGLSFLWLTFPSEVHSVNKVTDSLKERVVGRLNSSNMFDSFRGKVSVSNDPGFPLEIYFQMVHNSIGRYEMPSLHTATEMLSGKPG